MPTLSSLKNGVMSALRNPYEAHKPQSRQRVVSFNEALENLKTSQTGFVTCAAFHSFRKCRREIPLTDSVFLANLDRLNMADLQTPIKLMPFMLCSTHWEKTVYYNALFLDWLSVYGSKQDTQHYENIIIDYQSALAIDNKEHSLSNVPVSSNPIVGSQGRPASAPNSPTKEHGHTNNLQTTDQLEVHRDHDKSASSEPRPDHVSTNLPEVLVLVNMESYASIESGVAKLEIMYQENLKCIAMTSDGWRCQEIIHEEQLLKARQLLSPSGIFEAELSIDLLPPLVLCPGHALGELPAIYSERWAAFAEQRLPKEEAMSKFNADFWMSIQFFHNERSDEVAFWTKVDNFIRPPLQTPVGFQGHDFDFSLPDMPSNSEFKTTPRSWSSLEPCYLSETHAADYSTTRPVNLEISTITSPPTPAPALEPLSTSDNLEEDTSTPSDLESTDSSAIMSDGFTDLSLTDELPQPEADTSSVSKAVTKEAIPLEDRMDAQNSQPQMSKTPPLTEGAAQESIQSLSQDIIDSNLIKEMNSTIPQGGYVYIFKSPDRKLVKIGQAKNINCYKQQIQAECQLRDLDEVEVDSIHTKYPQRVAKLAHLELQNFRAKMTCQHHLHESSSEAVEQEHREWFDVPESVAIKSVQLWRDFVDKAYTSEGVITDKWARMLTLLPEPGFYEISSLEEGLRGNGKHMELHHGFRNYRYRMFLIYEER